MAKWVVDQVIGGTHSITRREFADKYYPSEDDSKSDWSRMTIVIEETLKRARYVVERRNDGTELQLIGEPEGGKLRYKIPGFDPSADAEEKKKIGELVANYLFKRENRHVLLGSGTTVYHVGLAMLKLSREKGRYK